MVRKCDRSRKLLGQRAVLVPVRMALAWPSSTRKLVPRRSCAGRSRTSQARAASERVHGPVGPLLASGFAGDAEAPPVWAALANASTAILGRLLAFGLFETDRPGLLETKDRPTAGESRRSCICPTAESGDSAIQQGHAKRKVAVMVFLVCNDNSTILQPSRIDYRLAGGRDQGLC